MPEANLDLATTYDLIRELGKRARRARDNGQLWPDYQPMAPSGQMTTDEVIEAGRQAMQSNHPEN